MNDSQWKTRGTPVQLAAVASLSHYARLNRSCSCLSYPFQGNIPLVIGCQPPQSSLTLSFLWGGGGDHASLARFVALGFLQKLLLAQQPLLYRQLVGIPGPYRDREQMV